MEYILIVINLMQAPSLTVVDHYSTEQKCLLAKQVLEDQLAIQVPTELVKNLQKHLVCVQHKAGTRPQ